MIPSSTCVYGVKHRARCIEALLADSNRHRFLVGSTALREKNEITLLEYNESTNELVCEKIFPHQQEIWDLSPHFTKQSFVFTCHKQENGRSATLWNIDAEKYENSDYGSEGHIESILTLPVEQDEMINRILWSPCDTTDDSRIVSLHNSKMCLWSLGSSKKDIQAVQTIEFEDCGTRFAAAYSPHHPTEASIALSRDVVCWDVRTSKLSSKIIAPHSQTTLSIDYNPNKPYHIVTSGEDGKVLFWDYRKPTQPLKILNGHKDWAWCARYNRFHDQLVLSAGSDSIVNLWRVSSISSAPLMELNEDRPGEEFLVEDTIIEVFDEHEESIYATAWSACDSWTFTSLSYDGRVYLNHVPSTEKYRILL